VTWPLPPGHTTLEWEYAKNDNISSGADAGWLDDVIYNRTPFSLNAPGVSNGTNFVFTLNGTIGQILVLQSSTNLFQWVPLVTNTMTSSMVNFTNSTTNFPNKFYRGMDITP
jgi:hypothetical protein